MSCEVDNIYDLCMSQNETFRLIISLKDDDGNSLNLSSWGFTASIKERRGNDINPVLFFTSSIIDPVSGTLQLFLSADSTWELNKPKYFYDLIGTNYAIVPPETLRLMQGKVTVRSGVTEP